MTRGKWKIIALGGCGAMGEYAVQTILHDEYIDEIIIADRDGERARRFAEQCGSGVTSTQIDIEDSSSLKNLLSKGDIVLNTVGPYFLFGKRVLQASIEAGCHYLDINDDPEPTLEMLELDEQAKKANVTAVIGMGASPGITNLIAAKAIGELDRAEEVHTVWNLDAASEPPADPELAMQQLERPGYQPNAAIVHGLKQLSGKIRIRENGRFVSRRPIKKIRIDYPGLGKGYAWTIGHPEPLTLPRYYPQIKNSVNAFVGPRKNVTETRILSWLVNLKILSIRRAAIMAEKDMLKKQAGQKDGQDWTYPVPRDEVPLPPLFAYARGLHNNRPASVAVMLTSAPPGAMGAITGIPLAIGLRLLANNKITRRGVFAPEAGIKPEPFFDQLAPFCEPKTVKGSDLTAITRSWTEDVPEEFERVIEEVQSSQMPL